MKQNIFFFWRDWSHSESQRWKKSVEKLYYWLTQLLWSVKWCVSLVGSFKVIRVSAKCRQQHFIVLDFEAPSGDTPHGLLSPPSSNGFLTVFGKSKGVWSLWWPHDNLVNRGNRWPLQHLPYIIKKLKTRNHFNNIYLFNKCTIQFNWRRVLSSFKFPPKLPTYLIKYLLPSLFPPFFLNYPSFSHALGIPNQSFYVIFKTEGIAVNNLPPRPNDANIQPMRE